MCHNRNTSQVNTPLPALQHSNLRSADKISAVELHLAMYLTEDLHIQIGLLKPTALLRQQIACVICIREPVQNDL